MKKPIMFMAACLFAVAFCAAQTQTGGSGFRQEGIASWYGAEFEGRPTASGELFDPNQFTAAHPDLPFGTALIITNAVNGEKVMVRVNDRGPFVKSRIIDVSRAAAEQLNMLETGTAQVIVELAPRNAVAGSQARGANQAAEQTSATATAALTEPEEARTAAAATTVAAATEPAATQAASQTQANQTQASAATPSAAPRTAASATGSPAAVTLPPSPTAPSYMPQQPTLAQAPSAPAARVPAQPVNGRTPPAQATSARVPAQTSSAAQSRQPNYTTQTLPAAPSSPARPQSGSVPVASFQPIPTATRPPAATTSSAPVMPSSAMVSSIPSAPAAQPQPPRNQPVYASAEIAGGPFVSGRYYRLQIGSYKVAKNAVDVFDRLSAAGLNPQWEPYGELYRVVISNVRAEDINTVAVRLGNAGFKEAIAREER
jgi:rare lipoprotein A